MGASFDAGRIMATADLDREPFRRSLRLLKEDAREIDKMRVSPTVGADTKEADRKVTDLRTSLDRLASRRVTPTLSVDNAAGLVKLVDFQDRLDKISRDVADARVDVNDDRAREKLDALQIRLREVGAITSRPKVTVEGVERANLQLDRLALKLAAVNREGRAATGGAGRGGGGLFSRLAGAGRGGFFGGFGGLLVGGAAASVPLGVGALGAGASLLTPTLAGASGLGLFGAASSSAIKRVEADQKKITALNARIAATPATNPGGTPQQIAAAQARLTAAQANLQRAQYVGGNARIASARSSVASAESSLTSARGGGPNKEYEKLVKQRKDLLDKLTPAERKAAEGTEKLDKEWVKFQRAVEPETFKALATVTDIVTKSLTALTPMTKAVGDEVDVMAKRVDTAVSDPFWQHFFGDFLTREAPRAVDTLGTSVGNIVTGVAHLAEKWSPLGHDLEHDAIRISGAFDKWTQGGGPKDFVDLVQRDGPQAADALKAIGSGLVGVGKGLEPIGRVELEALTPVLNFVGKLGDQHPAVITALGAAYLSVATGLKGIAAVNGIKNLAGVLSGGRLGGGGGGGRLGGAGASLKAPVPVYVTNWEGPGGPGVPPVVGPGGKPRTPTERPRLRTRLRARGGDFLNRAGSASGYWFAGDFLDSLTNHAGHGVFGNVGKGAALGRLLGPEGAVVGAGLGGAGSGLSAALSWASASDAASQKHAMNSVVAQLMAGGQGYANLSKLEAIAGRQSVSSLANPQGRVDPALTAEIRSLRQALSNTGNTTNFNLYNPMFTNVNSPKGLGQALQAQQRLRALSGQNPHGVRRAGPGWD